MPFGLQDRVQFEDGNVIHRGDTQRRGAGIVRSGDQRRVAHRRDDSDQFRACGEPRPASRIAAKAYPITAVAH